jgi:hypothetical protein
MNFEKMSEPVFEVDKDGFVRFFEVSSLLLNMQNQFGSRYLRGNIAGYPNLGEDLRIKDDGDHHSLRIHKDDIAEFIRRYKEYKASQK